VHYLSAAPRTWYEFSGKSLQWKPRYSRVGTLFSKWSTLNYWPITTNLSSFANAFVESAKFQFSGKSNQWKPWYSRKVQFLTSKGVLFIYRSQPNFQCLWRKRGELQDGSRDTALKVLRSLSKLPLIIDPIATKRNSFVARAWKVGGLKF